MATAKAGWAVTDITPPTGLPLGGRGPRFAPITHVIDPLEAAATALEDADGRRALLVSLDLIGAGTVFTFELRHRVAALTGVPLEAVVVNFSHTHSGPMTILDKYPVSEPAPVNLVAYERDLADAVTAVCLRAVDDLHPAEIRHAVGRSAIGINRRNRTEDGSMGMLPNPEGFYNPDLWVLDIRTATGRALLASHGCHPVTVYSWQWQACSSDFPGAFRRSIRSSLGEQVHSQFLQGFAGNVRPRRLADLDALTFRKSKEDDHHLIGAELAADVERSLAAASEVRLELSSAAGFFAAPVDQSRMPPLEHWEKLERADDELSRNLGRYWSDATLRNTPLARTVPWDIGLLRFARGLTVAWMAGEVCAEWLPLVRAWTGDERLYGIGYCQDLPAYLPTAALIEEGGYEAGQSNWYRRSGPAPFHPDVERAVREKIQALARALG